MPEVLFISGVVVLLPFFFLASISHDQLVRRLYEHHRETWTQCGGPRGFYWRPPDGLLPSSAVAFIKSSMTWAFRLPPPLADDDKAKTALFRLRVGLLVWNLGMVSLFAFILARYGFPPIG